MDAANVLLNEPENKMNQLRNLQAVLSTKAADAAEIGSEGGEFSAIRYYIIYDGLRMAGPNYDDLLARFKEKFPTRQLWWGTLRII